MTRAGVYARISKDDGSALGVARQLEDCNREAARRSWDIVQVYTDNDVSATRTAARPQYQRMLTDIRAGRVDALVVWDVDRLTRTPRELEDIIDLANDHGLELANVGGDIDLASDDGRMMARIKGTVARREVEQSSRRIRRKFDERATAGLPHGKAAYGYRRVVEYDDNGRRTGAHDEIHPGQAEVIRRTAKRLLAGESLRSAASTLNAEGSGSPSGAPWNSTTLRQVMLRDRNAGLRRHRGQVIGKGAWEPILDDDTHSAVVALLTDPQRRTNKGATRKHLLSGIARCGQCGGEMRVIPAFDNKRSGKHLAAKYGCKGCFKVARKQSVVDEYVEAVVIARLSRPDAVAALAAGDPERVEELRRHVEGLEARLGLAADEFADGRITGDQLRRITAKLRPQIDAAKADISTYAANPSLLDVAGVDAAKRWNSASLDVKRAIIQALMSVVIHGVGVGKGKSAAPESVAIEWKGEP